MVSWVERIALSPSGRLRQRAFKKRVACPQGHSETQQRIDNVGFRPSTQPTPANLFRIDKLCR